jgi:hypothetical protein
MLVRLQRLLSPEPAALFRLLNKPPSWIAAADLQSLVILAMVSALAGLGVFLIVRGTRES